MKVITISREFGSGGRELGKRMADILGFAYYDKEIITAIAKENHLSEHYISGALEKGLSGRFPITIGRTFSYPAYIQQNNTKLLVTRQKVIKELAAQGNCIVMGQSADIILKEYQPLNLFVYGEMMSKITRCKLRAPKDEHLTEKELIKKIKQVDTGRKNQRELFSDIKWGQKEGYHLCINTTGLQIKTLAPHIADYAKYWLGKDIL